MSTRIRNSGDKPKEVIIVSRETIRLEPGEEIEFTGDIELDNSS